MLTNNQTEAIEDWLLDDKTRKELNEDEKESITRALGETPSRLKMEEYSKDNGIPI